MTISCSEQSVLKKHVSRDVVTKLWPQYILDGSTNEKNPIPILKNGKDTMKKIQTKNLIVLRRFWSTPSIVLHHIGCETQWHFRTLWIKNVYLWSTSLHWVKSTKSVLTILFPLESLDGPPSAAGPYNSSMEGKKDIYILSMTRTCQIKIAVNIPFCC